MSYLFSMFIIKKNNFLNIIMFERYFIILLFSILWSSVEFCRHSFLMFMLTLEGIDKPSFFILINHKDDKSVRNSEKIHIFIC